MKSLYTKYGILNNVTTCQFYEGGKIKECTINSPNKVVTHYGILVPQFDDSVPRKKFTNSMSFYKSGFLKSIALENQTLIKTSYGTYPAELLTFYESGAIKRIFPLNGKITGYWSEEDEYKLAPSLNINLESRLIKAKIISIYFYESGEIKGLTLWSKEKIVVFIPNVNPVLVRIGITFYKDGSIKSLEPGIPTMLDTPVGKIEAFNTSPIGIHGDLNSLEFYNDGKIKSVMTSTNKIEVCAQDGTILTFKPTLIPNPIIFGKMEICPLSIEFRDNIVVFNNTWEYDINIYSFKVSKNLTYCSYNNSCGDCSTCNSCSL